MFLFMCHLLQVINENVSSVCTDRNCTVYPKKYAHGFVVLCFVVVMQSFIMNSHEVFIHIHHGCFVGTGAIVKLPQCQWSKPDGYGKISQCVTATKHSKAKTVCIFLGIYFICRSSSVNSALHGHNLPSDLYLKYRLLKFAWNSGPPIINTTERKCGIHLSFFPKIQTKFPNKLQPITQISLTSKT